MDGIPSITSPVTVDISKDTSAVMLTEVEVSPERSNDLASTETNDFLPQSRYDAINAGWKDKEQVGKNMALRPFSSDAPEASAHPLGAKVDHRKSRSVDIVPRQTVLKALASRRLQCEKQNLTIVPSISEMLTAGDDGGRPTATSDRLTTALSDLMLKTPSTARYPAVQSPCFFHRRFDDAVDIEKVLDEIADDEEMSHSRLMQTATGVREVSKRLQRRPIRRAVKTVMIVTKARDNHLVTLTRELAIWLLSRPRYGSNSGVNVYVDAKLRHSKRFDGAGLIKREPRFEGMLGYWTPDLCWNSPDRFDLVLTLGGDGTVLYTSWLFQRIVPPVLSFSLGSLGFLTNFEFDQYQEHLDGVMGEIGMRVNLRMRFTCTVYRGIKGKEGMEEGEQFEVLNELVIDRGPSPYVSNLELYGDDELLTVVQADGCIISTPTGLSLFPPFPLFSSSTLIKCYSTGSTAYSLSAGGSLVHPDIPAILLTPICPHTLSFRPMLLNDSILLKICIPLRSRATAYCSFDGKARVELRQGDHVTIAASQYPFPTVLSSGSEWFDSVSRTLRWNTRDVVQSAWSGPEKIETDEDGCWDIDTTTEDATGLDSGVFGSEVSSSTSTSSGSAT